MPCRFLSVFVFVLMFASCTTTPVAHAPDRDLGLLWVKHAAEYEAVTRQVYQAARLALPRLIEDQFWTALPGQEDAEGLRPAIIFDMDETVVSGIDFQLTHERPFENWKHEAWSMANTASAVPGFVRFAVAARDAGVELFFVTNRPCEPIVGSNDPCPQQIIAMTDIVETGIETDADHVMLAFEQSDWTKEKAVRRQHIARTHRVIMLFGDDLSDFIPCVRAKPAAPCTEAATADSRRRAVEQFSDYWGNGWYVLPNPMHGSWTSAR
ncbi:MAG: hypothetical protein OEM85_06780 [Gammaproteobacteria bacterium]|nr:hypothetical protein [Gammaproteobacteria bacterium]MDH3409040.1 hypothetical protein [Gammaproteobacteria bacterium]